MAEYTLEELEREFEELNAPQRKQDKSVELAEAEVKFHMSTADEQEKYLDNVPEISREQELISLKEDIKKYTNSIHKLKNTKSKKVNDMLAEKRKALRIKIELCKLKISEIEMELPE